MPTFDVAVLAALLWMLALTAFSTVASGLGSLVKIRSVAGLPVVRSDCSTAVAH